MVTLEKIANLLIENKINELSELIIENKLSLNEIIYDLQESNRYSFPSHNLNSMMLIVADNILGIHYDFIEKQINKNS
jgi:hypothetical protein